MDVVLDNMGAKYLARNIDALAVGGRLVVIGMQGGAKAELDLGKLLAKRASVHATGLRGRPATGPGGKAEIIEAVRRDVWPDVERGTIRPIVDRRLPMSRAAEAHRPWRPASTSARSCCCPPTNGGWSTGRGRRAATASMT